MRAAVIGIGSNSVRMLMADLDGNKGIRLQRDRTGTRLFAGLDAASNLLPESMAKTAEAVGSMAALARSSGADDMVLFATSATRDARNADVFAQMLKEVSGLELQVLSGEEEAMLSFYGASGDGYCGVIDIGGGSTEIILGEGSRLDFSVSCQMGAVRLSRLYPMTKLEDLDLVCSFASELLTSQVLPHTGAFPAPSAWFGTGGTFTTLAAMVNGVPWTDRTQMHGTVLPLDRIVSEARLLAPMTLDQRRALPGLQPNRADIIVHGICILISCMRLLNIPYITVSEYGNLDGFLKYHYRLRELN